MISKILGYFGYYKNEDIQHKIKEVVNASTLQSDQINGLMDGYAFLEQRNQHNMIIMLALIKTLTDDNSVFIPSQTIDDVYEAGLDIALDSVDDGIEVCIVDANGNDLDPEFEDDSDDGDKFECETD